MNILSTRFFHKDNIISAAILLVGIISFAIIVGADTASTTVTVGNAAPTISALALERTTITLNENSFVWASTSMTVTDNNGCGSITSVTAKLYFASTTNSSGTLCTAGDRGCYSSTCVATTTGTTCSTTAAQYDCGFKLWYTATPSDASAPDIDLKAGIWSLSATATDGTDFGTATNTTQKVEVGTLNALSLSGNIAYPQTSANSNTGATNQAITVTNTGNTPIRGEISGDVMCTSDYPTCSANHFGPSQQKFDLSDVTFASLTYTLAATSSPATIPLVLATTTATTTTVTDLTYWGIAIPSGQAAGAYTGQDTFTAIP
ncbi:MAG: hypothetical protein HZC03_02320 [Candidatus Lloydbacteria bacterium]|nr:hypothetical protein [Candidatus Lloydbacteria bacterium]